MWDFQNEELVCFLDEFSLPCVIIILRRKGGLNPLPPQGDMKIPSIMSTYRANRNTNRNTIPTEAN